MPDDHCPRCGSDLFYDRIYNRIHNCPPQWRVWLSGYDHTPDDDCTIYAVSADTAAEVYAEQYDARGDYPIIRDGGVEVSVAPVQDQAQIHVFFVRAESVLQYYADKM